MKIKTVTNFIKKESSNIPKSIITKPDHCIYLQILAKPNSSVSSISSIDEEEIGVHIAAKAQDGKANSQLISFMAEIIRIKKSSISLVSGQKSKNKILKIDPDLESNKNITAEDIYKSLRDQLPEDKKVDDLL